MHSTILATTWKAEAGDSLNTGITGQQKRERLKRIGKQKHTQSSKKENNQNNRERALLIRPSPQTWQELGRVECEKVTRF